MTVLRTTSAVVALALLPIPAYASDSLQESSSTATAQVTVYIPPIGPAIQASTQGAAGLWSISGQHNGIMINVIEDKGYIQSVDIFSRRTSGIELQWESGLGPARASNPSEDDGLVRNRFAVPDDVSLVSTFTIRAI